ncbi:MAG: PAS domain S-box protein, partial [Nitrospiraceae bacterium]|nr:PAS domain S-box protein [Nitrospiraceae bacterium]
MNLDRDENVNRLQKEIRTLRSALETTGPGKTMLRQQEEFSRLLSVSTLIVSELDLDRVFQLVADNARDIVLAELVIVPMLNEARDHYTYVAASGEDAEAVRGTRFGSHIGMCGWVLRHKRSLLFGETSTHWTDEMTKWEEGQQSAVLVPLFGRKGIIGGLSALGKQGGGCFTQHDLDLLTMFANQVSIAIENAQLFSQITREIEDRKRAEDALHISRNMLRQVLNTMPQSIFWKDRECVYLGCNDVFAKAVGIDNPAEIVGKTDFDLPWPRPEAEAYRADDQEVMAANRPKRNIIEPLQQADGTRIWIDTSKVPLVDREGRVFGVLGVYEDITSRKLAEEKLKKSEAQLRESQTVARLGSWDLDLVTKRLEWSDETYALFDLSPEDFLPSFDEFARMVHPGDADAIRNAFDHALASDADPYHVTVRIINDSGRQWVMEAFGAVRRGSDGRALSIFGTAQDITVRKEAEEKIRVSEQFIRRILDTVDDGFIVVDRDYRILTVNRAYCEQIGGCEEGVVGKHCYEISHNSLRPCFEQGEECAVRQVFETGEPYSSLHRHEDANGDILYVETKAYPIRDASGEITSAIETISNITEKHLLEEERLKTQKLESIGTLAGGIAHDFNNLLQSIFGYISMAKLRISNPRESLSVLSQAEKALVMAVNLTKQLLTFSKGGKPVTKPVSLPAVIENASNFALSGSRSSCRFEFERGLWRVDADEGQLGQVIQNIVLNADQAMPEGGVVLVAARNIVKQEKENPQLPAGSYVEISVKDTGVGIPEKYLQKIFDPYFTTTAKR